MGVGTCCTTDEQLNAEMSLAEMKNSRATKPTKLCSRIKQSVAITKAEIDEQLQRNQGEDDDLGRDYANSFT